MIERRKSPRIFFGWWTVLAGGFLALWIAGYHGSGFSALFKPIASELGFSRAVASIPASIGTFEGGFEAPLSGWLTDRFGPRWIVISAVFLIVLSLILMNYINSLWAFLVVWGVMLGTAHNIIMGPPLHTAISNWFVKKRGLALGIRATLAGLGGTLVLPLIAWLITVQGWRMTCVIGGLVMGVVGLPLAWFSVKQHRPEYYGLLPDGATSEAGSEKDRSQMIERGVKYAAEVEEVEFTLGQAMRTPAYWLLVLAPAAHRMVGPAVNIHGIPFLTDIGIPPVRAAGMLATMYLASIPARLVGGLLADRVRKSHLRFLLAGAFSLQVVGFAVFLLNQTIPMIYVWLVLYGIGHGAGVALTSPLTARYFGRKAFGSISGSIQLFMMPAGVAAPVYLGWVYDTTGSYISAFTLLAALIVFSAVLVSFTVPPKPPAQITGISKIV